MTTPSMLTAELFVTLVGIMTCLVVLALRRAYPRPNEATPRIVAILAFLTMYVLIPALLGVTGALDRYAPLPTPGAIFALALTFCTVGIAVSRVGKRIAASLSLPALVGYQFFRVPLEWLLHRLYLEGVIPVQMTFSGRNFDILTGLSAVGIAWWLSRHPSIVPRRTLLFWNLLGLALLVNVVTVAILSTPAPFRYFMVEPANLLPSTFPYVWLPFLLVQLALFGHVVLFGRINVRAAT